MLAAVLTVLAAAPVQHLAAPGITTVDGKAEEATFYTEHLAQALGRRGVTVMTPKQLAAVIGLERQKELAGCSDTGCMVELANGLGVDGLLLGEVGRFGERYQVNLKVVAAADAKLLASWSGRADRPDDVLDRLEEGAGALAVQLGVAAPAPVRSHALRSTALLVGGLGLLAAVAGGISFGLSRGAWGALHDPSHPLSDDAAMSIASAGSVEQALGLTGLAVGGAAICAAVIFFVVDRLGGP